MLQTHYKSNHKYKKKHNTQGVTLIELLVVITIMMTMMSLVAPLAINTINKAEAQSEFLSFCAIIRRASIIAFSNGREVQIALNKNNLTVYQMNIDNSLYSLAPQSTNKVIIAVDYKYLTFNQESYINFNRNGMTNIFSLDFKQHDKPKSLDLLKLLEG